MKQRCPGIALTSILCAWLLAACAAEEPDADVPYLPPASLIRANLAETPLTASFTFREVVGAPADSEPGIDGTWRIRAELGRIYRGGSVPGGDLTFHWRHERGVAPPVAGERWIGSLRRNARGDWFVPDNGYLFPAHPRLERAYREAAGELRTSP